MSMPSLTIPSTAYRTGSLPHAIAETIAIAPRPDADDFTQTDRENAGPIPAEPLSVDLPLPVDIAEPDAPTPAERRRRLMMLLGCAAAFLVALHFTVTRPMASRIDSLAAQVATARTQLDAVAGSRTDAWRTNDLLTALSIQKDRLREAETAAMRLDELADSVASVGRRTEASLAAVSRLEHLEDRLAAATADIDQLLAGVSDIRKLHVEVDRLDDAAGSRIASIDTAVANLDSLEVMADRLADQTATIAAARSHEQATAALVDEIVAHAPRVAPATEAAESLIALSARVESTSTASAEAMLDRTEAMQERIELAHDALASSQQSLVEAQTATAGAIAQSQTDLAATVTASTQDLAADIEADQTELAARVVAAQAETASRLTASEAEVESVLTAMIERQSEQLVELVESTELLADFHSEMLRHTASLRGMRRELLDLAMMESTFTRVARSLQPLVSLADLRHLSPGEVRLAADAIRRDRGGIDQLADTREAAALDQMADRLVPQPIDGPVVR